MSEFDLWGTPRRPRDLAAVERGVAACMAAIGAADDAQPLDPTNAIRDRALRRARADREAAARRARTHLARAATTWNANYEVGTLVDYWLFARDLHDVDGGGSTRVQPSGRGVTTGHAMVVDELNAPTAVVWIAGHVGPVALTHVRVVESAPVESLDDRLARRLPPDHPDYDAFYDASDADLVEIVSGMEVVQ